MDEMLVTVRVSRDLKERMKRAGINWSEELREAIRTRLETDQKRSANDDLERVISSVRPGFDSTKAIREARRHG